jgi:hypothetical protein
MKLRPLLLFFALAFPLQGQQNDANQLDKIYQEGRDRQAEREMQQKKQIEQAYSPDYTNITLVKEKSRTSDRNLKMDALSIIDDMLAEDKRDEELLSALEYMALEGTLNKAQSNRKISNSYPDVRVKTALCLGDYGGDDAKKILLQMIKYEPETMTLTQTVKALSKIGITERDETPLNTMMRRFITRYPDHSLAIAFLDAYQKYVEEGGKVNFTSRELIYSISQGHYRTPVKDKAKHLLEQIQVYARPIE